MSDFTSDFWSYYVSIITVVSIIACGVLLWTMSSQRVSGSKTETMGHVWDENLEEYNNPLPNWWRWMFYLTIVFGFAYLALYPGLGQFVGGLKWTSDRTVRGGGGRGRKNVMGRSLPSTRRWIFRPWRRIRRRTRSVSVCS